LISNRKMKILFLSRWFPYPINNGSKIRIYNLLRGLSQHHDVTLLSFSDQSGANLETPEIREICSNVKVVPWREFNRNTIRARLGIFSPKPRSIVDTFSSEMAQAIVATLNEGKYDLIIASQLQMAAYYKYFQDVPAVFEELEIGLFYDQAFSLDGRIRIRHALTWFKLYIYLSQLLGFFQMCTVVSERECQLFVQNFPAYKNRIEIIPNCLNVDEYINIKTDKKTNTLVFTGPFKYRANYEAMLWFVGEVFPLILRHVPDTQLIITGEHAGLPLPSSQNITLAGHVDDIKALVASCVISIAPLLSGGGTRLKILEAMALGIPVVATVKGAEGLDVVNNEHLLLADTPVEFAKSVISLLVNDELYRRLEKNSGLLVRTKYDWDMVLPNYLKLINTIV
jgi:polysaccharide biosynthesis protein PslH